MTTDNRTNEQLAERLRQFAESQAMDFDSPNVAMTLNEVADRLVAVQEVTPVLPSSGVDEDKLAEVIGYACNSEHHDPATHAARAVAEWLKE